MKVLICFKAAEKLDSLTPKDWNPNADLQVDVSFVKSELNCFDESALEMALKLRDSFDAPEECHLTAFAVGDTRQDMFLKTLCALRFDKAVRVDSGDEDIRFSSKQIAGIIDAYVKEETQDVIITGSRSSLGSNGKTALLAAELLAWPCITHVMGIERSGEHLKVTSSCDEGILVQTVQTPIVLTVGNAPNSYMRVPTLKDKMTFGKKAIEIIPIQDLGIRNSRDELTDLRYVDHSRNAIRIDGEDAKEKAYILYHEYLKDRIKDLTR